MQEQQIRAALDQRWAASDANDFETEHRIYHEDAVLQYPQSGEQTRGRSNIQNQRSLVSRAKSGFLSDESLATVRFGSANSS
jgi:ketosteroid isomerase-like protein